MTHKIKTLSAVVAMSAMAGVSAIGLASADTMSAKTPMTSSTIPFSVLRSERLSASAQVLHTTPTAIQSARKNHSVKQLIKQSGLTKKTFGADMKKQLRSDLEKEGYSQAQVAHALHHRASEHARRHIKTKP